LFRGPPYRVEDPAAGMMTAHWIMAPP
jgi:hypothetical protein